MKRRFLSLIFLAVSVIFCSCKFNSLFNENASISISLPFGNSRAGDSVKYSFVVDCFEGAEVSESPKYTQKSESGKVINFNNVTPGTYTVRVLAYEFEDFDTLIYVGQETKVVAEGITTKFAIQMKKAISKGDKNTVYLQYHVDDPTNFDFMREGTLEAKTITENGVTPVNYDWYFGKSYLKEYSGNNKSMIDVRNSMEWAHNFDPNYDSSTQSFFSVVVKFSNGEYAGYTFTTGIEQSCYKYFDKEKQDLKGYNELLKSAKKSPSYKYYSNANVGHLSYEYKFDTKSKESFETKSNLSLYKIENGITNNPEYTIPGKNISKQPSIMNYEYSYDLPAGYYIVQINLEIINEDAIISYLDVVNIKKGVETNILFEEEIQFNEDPEPNNYIEGTVSLELILSDEIAEENINGVYVNFDNERQSVKSHTVVINGKEVTLSGSISVPKDFASEYVIVEIYIDCGVNQCLKIDNVTYNSYSVHGKYDLSSQIINKSYVASDFDSFINALNSANGGDIIYINQKISLKKTSNSSIPNITINENNKKKDMEIIITRAEGFIDSMFEMNLDNASDTVYISDSNGKISFDNGNVACSVPMFMIKKGTLKVFGYNSISFENANCTSDKYGGIIGTDSDSDGAYSLNFQDCILFYNNKSVNGGAINIAGIPKSVNFTEVEFRNNTSSIYGGAIYINDYNQDSDYYITFDSVTLQYNESNWGGGIYVKNGHIAFENGLFLKGNNAKNGYGGGIYVSQGEIDDDISSNWVNFDDLNIDSFLGDDNTSKMGGDIFYLENINPTPSNLKDKFTNITQNTNTWILNN